MDDGTNRISRLGFSVIGVVFGGLILWSFLAPIDSAVIASGNIVVESNRKAVQHLEGGIIGEILVREGERVEAGAILVRMDNTVTKANVTVLEDQISERIARQARLFAERDGLAEIPATSLAFKSLPEGLDIEANLIGQRALLAARAETRATQISLLEENIVQQEKRITGFESQRRSYAAQIKLVNAELEGTRTLHEKGFAPLTRVRALEREAESLAGRRGAMTASIAEAESIISGAKLEIARLGQQYREEAINELRETTLEIAELRERYVAASASLKRTEIRAPQAGRVLGLAIHTIGGVIGPGQPIMEIVPDNVRLLVRARIAPRDVDKVHAGAEAVMRFTALNSRTTPEAIGEVRHVSADNIQDKITGAPFYEVLIELPDNPQIVSLLENGELVPGMPVESFIRTGPQPAISYILRPLTNAMARSLREE